MLTGGQDCEERPTAATGPSIPHGTVSRTAWYPARHGMRWHTWDVWDAICGPFYELFFELRSFAVKLLARHCAECGGARRGPQQKYNLTRRRVRARAYMCVCLRVSVCMCAYLMRHSVFLCVTDAYLMCYRRVSHDAYLMRPSVFLCVTEMKY